VLPLRHAGGGVRAAVAAEHLLERRPHSLDGALADLGGTLLVGIHGDDRELVAAVARDEVVRAHCLAQRAADAAQHLVTDQVALPLVHLLEVVEVHEDDREAPPGPPRALHLAPERLVQRGVVEAAREAVGARRLGEPGLHARVAARHRRELGEARQQLQILVAGGVVVAVADPESAAPLAVPAHRRRQRAADALGLRTGRVAAHGAPARERVGRDRSGRLHPGGG
jgi:hypothetical protein